MYAELRVSFYLWAVEDVLDGEHRHYGQDLIAAREMDGHDEHLGELRLQGKLCHLVGGNRTTDVMSVLESCGSRGNSAIWWEETELQA